MCNCCICTPRRGIATTKDGSITPILPLAIEWPLARDQVSERDRGAPLLDDGFSGVSSVKCRFCAAALQDVFLDLGTAPPSNAFLFTRSSQRCRNLLPLEAVYLHELFPRASRRGAAAHATVRLGLQSIFRRSRAPGLLHAERYVEHAVARLELGRANLVMEIASNDGYLVQYVAATRHSVRRHRTDRGHGKRCAQERHRHTRAFFWPRLSGEQLVGDRGQADLIVANNVLAHVPDLNDFVAGLAVALAPNGARSSSNFRT